ncbi:unnamed protein product [Effrenium voratum]|uniref:Uncharacterized protein n=1 Tax=Effrenium voratum TaxID=2562239 RepID=A0AA36J5W9_9DINO|nr:unnamed protein product [Effrenium voratum]
MAGFVPGVAVVKEEAEEEARAEEEAEAAAAAAAAAKARVEEAAHSKAGNLPTCFFLATSAKCTKDYEGDYKWVIELEKGWCAWMPGNEPFYGGTDAPMRYILGRYEFEVHFESDSNGTQTNLATGKVRRIQKITKNEPMPTWEGTGIRRRPELAKAPSAAASNFRRDGAASPQAAPMKPKIPTRPAVSQSAYQPVTPAPKAVMATPSAHMAQSTWPQVPRYMRQLKSKV